MSFTGLFDRGYTIISNSGKQRPSKACHLLLALPVLKSTVQKTLAAA
jgi:hypothetical protein